MLTIAAAPPAARPAVRARSDARFRRRLGPPSPPRRLLLSPLAAAYRGPAGRLGLELAEEGAFFADGMATPAVYAARRAP